MSLLVVGSVAYDAVETPKGKVERALGGSAVYFSAAASLFTQVNAVGVVGDDYNFTDLDFLKKRGVNLDGIKQVPGETFYWGGVYGEDPNERETLFTRLGVFADFKPAIPAAVKKTPFVFLANIDPGLQSEVLKQMKKPKFVALDTMNFWITGRLEALLEVLKQTDLLFVNDQEIRQLTGCKDIFQGAAKIFAMGPKMVVVKKGENGAVLLSGKKKFFSTIYPVEEVVDPTGAGDTFAGGFMGYVGKAGTVNWETLKTAMIYGAAAASFAVEDFSVDRLKKVTLKEIEKRVKAIREMTSF